MKRIIYFFALSAIVIGLSACGGGNGNGSKNSGTGYKEPFGFFETYVAKYEANAKKVDFPAHESERRFKKEETEKQKEVLDRMVAEGDKKIACIQSKYFYADGWVGLNFLNTPGGNKIGGENGQDVALNPKEFPEVLAPFGKYYIILDKNGDIARLEHVPGSYSWDLEHPQTRSAIFADLANAHQLTIDELSESRVPDRVKESRRQKWENGMKSGGDPYANLRELDPRLGWY